MCAAMPQNVPSFEFSDRAKQVRAFVFEFWCDHGRGPTLREVHEATELDRRQIIQAYKELQLGIVITVDENTQNCNLLKAPPFSSYPSQVRAYIDDEFHSFVGCASEAVVFSHMPPFKDKTVRLESHCACCMEPVTLVSKNFELQSVTPPARVPAHHVAVGLERRHGADVRRDELRDRRRARRSLRTADRGAGVLVNLDQAKMFVQGVANERMWNHDWAPVVSNPRVVIKGFQMMGVDTSPWGEVPRSKS